MLVDNRPQSAQRKVRINSDGAIILKGWDLHSKLLFKCIFLNENVRISIKISLKSVSKGPIENKSALVQVMV